MAKNYSPRIRVNAIAPGFFLTERNRFLLIDKESGELTARGQSILAHTPMNRFGTPEDLLAAPMLAHVLSNPQQYFNCQLIKLIYSRMSAQRPQSRSCHDRHNRIRRDLSNLFVRCQWSGTGAGGKRGG